MTGGGSAAWPTFPLIAGHSLHNQLHRLDGRAGEFASMFSVADLVSRPFLARRVGDLGFRAACPDHKIVVLDSGGYQHLKRGDFVLAHDELVTLYARARPDFAVALDRPVPAACDPATRRAILDENIEAYGRMIDRLGAHMLLPVVHGEEVGDIGHQCRAIARLAAPRVVGVGGNVPYFKAVTHYRRNGHDCGRQLALATAFVRKIETVRAAFPASALHVFGAGGFLTVALCLLAGADTVDSAGWRLRAAFGVIQGRGGSEVRVRRSPVSLRELLVRFGGDLAACSCPSCAVAPTVESRAEAVLTSFRRRALHNLWTLAADTTELRLWAAACRNGQAGTLTSGASYARQDFLLQLAADVASASLQPSMAA